MARTLFEKIWEAHLVDERPLEPRSRRRRDARPDRDGLAADRDELRVASLGPAETQAHPRWLARTGRYAISSSAKGRCTLA